MSDMGVKAAQGAGAIKQLTQQRTEEEFSQLMNELRCGEMDFGMVEGELTATFKGDGKARAKDVIQSFVKNLADENLSDSEKNTALKSILAQVDPEKLDDAMAAIGQSCIDNGSRNSSLKNKGISGDDPIPESSEFTVEQEDVEQCCFQSTFRTFLGKAGGAKNILAKAYGEATGSHKKATGKVGPQNAGLLID